MKQSKTSSRAAARGGAAGRRVIRQGRARHGILLVAGALSCGLVVAAAQPDRPRAKRHSAHVTHVAAAPDAFATQVAPLVKKYCVSCHSGGSPSAGITLSGYTTTAGVLKGRDVWEKVSENVGQGHMPPSGVPHPSAAERVQIASWIDSTLSKSECKLQDPGRVTMRRLNREEYNNTVRDLLGVTSRPADEFPSDDVGYGFDNIGDVLSISPLLMEKYMTAAEKISRAAVVLPDQDATTTRKGARGINDTSGDSVQIPNGRTLIQNGVLATKFTVVKDGDFILRVRAYGEKTGPEPVKAALRLDGVPVKNLEVTAAQASPQVYELRVPLKTGEHRFAVALLNHDAPSADATVKTPDRKLSVLYLEAAGPYYSHQDVPDSQKRLIPVPPTPATQEAVARKTLGEFARRAYRRPVTAAETDRLMRVYDLAMKQGEPFERGIQLGIEAVLVSPHFLFKVEVDPNPNNPKALRTVNDYELATRLSYFLWSSMPDDELLTLAGEGRLHDPQVENAQVKRMLKDPKAHALADNFAGQWLTLRNLNGVNPNPAQFPDFNDSLRNAMRTETEMFFEDVAQEDRSVLDFIDGKFTYLNEPLAKHYGITGVTGNDFRKVALTGDQRAGVLTQASILTVTSNPTRTSPVKRGKWILEQFLGTPPPPPPPGVGVLKDDKGGQLTGSLRQRMEQHRKNPSCAACHAKMDPLGFGLENYDAVGQWRNQDGKFLVDATGVLPDGAKFNGPGQLRAILRAKKSLFVRCLAEKMLTYSLGRGLESFDRCAVDGIVKTVAKDDYHFSSLVSAVVQSEPFRKRRGDSTPTKALAKNKPIVKADSSHR